MERKKVIALRGRANVGKSQTIKEVYGLLRSKYQCGVEWEKNTRTDVRAVLIIDGVRIGIESQGDPRGRLADSLSLFARIGCRVIVCATRTRGGTVDAVNNLRPNYEPVWLDQVVKPNASQQEASNDATARRIVRDVEGAF
jgi:hypothetical protein